VEKTNIIIKTIVAEYANKCANLLRCPFLYLAATIKVHSGGQS